MILHQSILFGWESDIVVSRELLSSTHNLGYGYSYNSHHNRYSKFKLYLVVSGFQVVLAYRYESWLTLMSTHIKVMEFLTIEKRLLER